MLTKQQINDQMDVHQSAWQTKQKEIKDRVSAGGAEMTAEEQSFVKQHMDEFDKLDVEAKKIIAARKEREDLENRGLAIEEAHKATWAERTDRRPLQPDRNAAESKPFSLKIGDKTVQIDPKSALGRRMTPEYEAEVNHYLSSGFPSATLQTTEDTKGGYLAPTRMAAELIRAVTDQTYMRQLCRVLPPIPDAVSLGVLSLDTRPGAATWGAEVPALPIAPVTDPAFGKREMFPHQSNVLLEISEKLIRTSVLPIEQIVQEELVRNVGELEEQAFLTGDGNKKPLGVFTASAQGIPAGDVTTLAGRDFTAATSLANGAFNDDDLIDMVYSLKEQYMREATWLVSREFLKRVRKMKSGDGVPLWSRQMGLTGLTEPVILERPYVASEFVPSTYSANAYVAILGAFKRYWIVDSLGLTFDRLTDSAFKLKNKVGILVRKETDGMPVLAEAFVRLKLAAA